MELFPGRKTLHFRQKVRKKLRSAAQLLAHLAAALDVQGLQRF
jgi:hypothetical protein